MRVRGLHLPIILTIINILAPLRYFEKHTTRTKYYYSEIINV